jgi:hypothetical protein
MSDIQDDESSKDSEVKTLVAAVDATDTGEDKTSDEESEEDI